MLRTRGKRDVTEERPLQNHAQKAISLSAELLRPIRGSELDQLSQAQVVDSRDPHLVTIVRLNS